MTQLTSPTGPATAAAHTVPPHPLLERYHHSETERRRGVSAWFDRAAVDYDWVSQFLAFGSGNWHRREELRKAGVGKGSRVLDVACGTGMVTAAAAQLTEGAPAPVALDASLGMLQEAKTRGMRRLHHGLAEALPFRDESFDFVSMGYALRHVTDLVATFREYRRVLRPGGRVLILEITPPRTGMGKAVMKLHLRYFVPAIARLGRGGRETQDVFAYFWDTMEACVPPAAILDALTEAGLTEVGRKVDFGMFSTYSAVR